MEKISAVNYLTLKMVAGRKLQMGGSQSGIMGLNYQQKVTESNTAKRNY